MPKKPFNGFVIILSLIFICGCTAATNVKEEMKKIKVRSYAQDKARVDQEIEGKVGNWENAPMAEDPERRMTRKMYYLEFTKEADPETTSEKSYKDDTDDSTSVESLKESFQESSQTTKPSSRFKLPFFGESESETMETESFYTEYKVEKDDTLQKISKKFYNSHSKWQKIYEANKDKIKNPDFIKPGIVLRIPSE